MSNIIKAKADNKKDFTIKETDFLLKLIMNSKFDGTELETAYGVLMKLSKIHKAKLEN